MARPDDDEDSYLPQLLKDYIPRGDYEEALAALEEIAAERDQLRTDHEAVSKRAKELETKHRDRTYRDAFEKVRKDMKVKDSLADDAFRLLDIERDKDEPDEGRIKGALEKFLKDRKDYLQQEETPRERARKAEIPAGEGAARGSAGRPGEPEMVVSRKQLADALWMRDNQHKVLAAQKAGNFRLEDEV